MRRIRSSLRTDQVRNLIVFLLITTFVVCGAFLRFHNLIEYAFFDVDMSRDILAVDHILRFGEFHSAIPLAEGGEINGQAVLSNSFFYFYFLVPFYMLGRSPESVLYVMNGLSVVGIVVFFLIGNKMSGRWAGIISAMFFATNIVFIEANRDIWQPFVLASLLPYALYCFVDSWKTKSRWSYFATLILFGVLIHIHLSVLSLIPLLFIYFLDMSRHFFTTDRKVFWLGVGTVFCTLCLWLIGMKWSVTPSELITFLASVRRNSLDQNLPSDLESSFIRGRNVAPFFSYIILVLIAGISSGFHAVIGLPAKRATVFKVWSIALIILGSYLLSRAFFAAKFYYFLPYYYFLVIGLGYAVAQLRSTGLKILVTVSLMLLSLSGILPGLHFHREWYDTDILQKRLVAQVMLQDELHSKNQKNAEHVGVLSMVNYGSGWFRSDGHALWYFLEQSMETQLVTIGAHNADLTVLHTPDAYYLSCEAMDIYVNGPDRCLREAELYLPFSAEQKACANLNVIEVSYPDQWRNDLWKYRVFSVEAAK